MRSGLTLLSFLLGLKSRVNFCLVWNWVLGVSTAHSPPPKKKLLISLLSSFAHFCLPVI